MDQISNFSDIIPAKQILYIIDACYSGIAGIVNKGSQDDGEMFRMMTSAQINLFFESTGRQIMTAGSSKEKAIMGKKWNKHSVYTYYLLKGLQGEADYNKDSLISSNELQIYVAKNVSRDTEGKQNPQLHSLGESEGNFIFFPEGDY